MWGSNPSVVPALTDKSCEKVVALDDERRVANPLWSELVHRDKRKRGDKYQSMTPAWDSTRAETVVAVRASKMVQRATDQMASPLGGDGAMVL